MRVSRMLPGAACALLCGCVTTPYHAKVPDVSAACASGWTQLPATAPYAPTPDHPVAPTLEFADHASCLGPPALPARTSVVLYDLHTLGRPAALEISLPIAAGGTLAGAVDLLDNDFHVMQRRGFDAFTRRGTAYTLTVFLRDDGPRYLALMPDLSYVGKQVTSIGSQGAIVPITTVYVSFLLAEGKETKVDIPLMAGGQVGVTVLSSTQTKSVPGPILPNGDDRPRGGDGGN